MRTYSLLKAATRHLSLVDAVEVRRFFDDDGLVLIDHQSLQIVVLNGRGVRNRVE